MARRRRGINFGSLIKRMAQDINAYNTQARLDDYVRGKYDVKEQMDWAQKKLSHSSGTDQLRWGRYIDRIQKDGTEDRLTNALSRGEISAGEVAGWLRENRLADMDQESPAYDDYLTTIKGLEERQKREERSLFRAEQMLKFAQTKNISVKIDMYSKIAEEAYNDGDYLGYIRATTGMQNAINTRDGYGSSGYGGGGKESTGVYDGIQDTEDRLDDILRGGLRHDEAKEYKKIYNNYVVQVQDALERPDGFWSEDQVRGIEDKVQDMNEGTAKRHVNYATATGWVDKTGYNPIRDGVDQGWVDNNGNQAKGYNIYDEDRNYVGPKQRVWIDRNGILQSKDVTPDDFELDPVTGEETIYDPKGVFVDPLTGINFEQIEQEMDVSELPDEVKDIGGYEPDKDDKIKVQWTYNPFEPLTEGQERTRFAVNPNTGNVVNTNYWAIIDIAGMGAENVGLAGWEVTGKGPLKDRKIKFDPKTAFNSSQVESEAAAAVRFRRENEPGYALRRESPEELIRLEKNSIINRTYNRGVGSKIEFEKTAPEEFVAGQVGEPGKAFGLEELIPGAKIAKEERERQAASPVDEAGGTVPGARVPRADKPIATGYEAYSPAEGQFGIKPTGTTPGNTGYLAGLLSNAELVGERARATRTAKTSGQKYQEGVIREQEERLFMKKRLDQIKAAAAKTPKGSFERDFAKIKLKQFKPKSYVSPNRGSKKPFGKFLPFPT